MNEIIQAAAELQAFCESHGWQFCFIGGVALQRWGEPRETIDVDVSLLAGFGDEERFSDALLTQALPQRVAIAALPPDVRRGYASPYTFEK